MAFESLSDKLTEAFKRLRGKGRLTEADVKEAMREVKLALLEADVNFKVVKDFVRKVTERATGADVLESLSPAQMVIKIVNEELTALMGSENQKLNISSQSPSVVMLVGLQGAGKTTNGAKLAGLMRKQGKRPLLVACDVYRPAAIQQLETVGRQLDIPVFQMGQGDPVEIAKAGIEHAKKHGNDLVFLDTAGRLHIDEALMTELQNIKAAVNPAEILLVIDAMIGQDAVATAQAFDDALDITGVMLTKLDGDARGGAALSIKALTGKPIKFAGIGEKLDQIEPFHPDRMASRILGMGDVLTLIEKAEQNLDQKKAEEMAERLRQNRFTLTDYYDQLQQIKGMGSLQDIAGIRIVCYFVGDIKNLIDMLKKQSDLIFIRERDYITNPKPNGYRSHHIILGVNVFCLDASEYYPVEIQLRTISMDFWAAMEHRISYKKEYDNREQRVAELLSYADTLVDMEKEFEKYNENATLS